MLINKTTRKNLGKIKLCSGLQKAIGLMFHKKVDTAFIFPLDQQQQVLLHTFFVFFPIYVLFLDEQKKVIRKARMKPFTLLKQKASYVVEFTSRKPFNLVHIGHKLSWQ